jgi:hypothetical protein
MSASSTEAIEGANATSIGGEVVAHDVCTAGAPIDVDSDSDFDHTSRSLASTPVGTDLGEETETIIEAVAKDLRSSLMVDEPSEKLAIVTALTDKMKILDKELKEHEAAVFAAIEAEKDGARCTDTPSMSMVDNASKKMLFSKEAYECNSWDFAGKAESISPRAHSHSPKHCGSARRSPRVVRCSSPAIDSPKTLQRQIIPAYISDSKFCFESPAVSDLCLDEW